MRASGYTLLELLVVLAVLGVLMALSFSTYRNARLRAETRQAAVDLAAALRDARSLAQRYSVDAEVRFPDPANYELRAEDRDGKPFRAYARHLKAHLELAYSLDGTHWRSPTTLKHVTYSAPFGEVSASAILFRVRQSRAPKIAACVRVIGVTGKVVIAHACP